MVRYIFCLMLFFCVFCRGFAQTKLIIDTDPGIDDLMAVVLAFNTPDIEMIGITTVFGNVNTNTATKNALTLVEYFNQAVPVYHGSEKPLVKASEPPPSFVHGEDGFGNINLPAPKITAQPQNAVDFIIEAVHQYPHEVTILAIGPQTNLAKAAQQDPSIVPLVKELVIMGGAFETQGNMNEYAEANIYADPEAAAIVASKPWHKTYVGLDVTMKCLLTKKSLKDIEQNHPEVGKLMLEASNLYFDFHKDFYGMENESHLHDPTALIYILHPEWFTTKTGSVHIETQGQAAGKTFLKAQIKDTNAKICTEVSSSHVLQSFKSRLSASSIV